MDISFELYKVFYYVSSTLSFSQASEKLFISQSAVSQSIKLLEKKLGCRLFFRNTKKIRLTKEGEVLYRHIEQAFNIIKSGERTLEEMHSLTQGEIRIGASDTICKYYLMPHLKKFNHAYPNVKLQITNRTSPKCIDLLIRGKVDFAVVNISDRQSYEDMEVKRLKSVRDIFIAGRAYQELENRELSLKELESYPLLVLEKNTITREFFDAMLEKYEVAIKPEVELGSVDLLIDMAKIGLGVAFVPEECIMGGNQDEDLFVLDIKEKIPERYLGIITYKDIPLSTAAMRFIEMMD